MTAISLIFNLFTATISLLALVVSSLIATRQARYQRSANHVPIMADIMRSFRSAEFREESFMSNLNCLWSMLRKRGLGGTP
jgi:hypothetical protein